MPTTRSAGAEKAATGEKHKTDISEPPAKARKTEKRKQATLEETLGQDKPDDEEKNENGQDDQHSETKADLKEAKEAEETNENKKGSKDETTTDTAVAPHGRHGTTPSNILEKGIIYFFFRGRVNTDEPQGVKDIARSYFLLRPLPKDAKLGDGPIGDDGNSRLCALPKKTLPQTGRDRWLVFVEKTGVSFAELKETFLSSQEYETRTLGTRHKPAATPAAEGVYAITSTGRENHLAYMITLPAKMGEVQQELGLKQKGSFIVSTRNPSYPPPKYAQLPEGPKYSQEILDEFQNLRWTGTLPKHLDIENTQFLLVGESIDNAMQPEKKGEEPIEEMETLEHEDTLRMQHLAGDESSAIFADLEARAKDYPPLKTTF